ncbi:MAG: hypothetical protein GF311_22930, partial [Candidatus Lokiarchaeota archaeon]|nr:hypothetical protein [Candidatus Lokiarchaeota archaeon]
MSSKKDLRTLFDQWDTLNNEVGQALQGLDFTTIKEIRKGQKKIEDSIYEILKEKAPLDLKKILPEAPG